MPSPDEARTATDWRRSHEEEHFRAAASTLLLDEARQAAEAEGALSQLINVAVAEKLSALRTEKYFAERAGRASISKALDIRKCAGVSNPPAKRDKVRRGKRT